MRPLPPSIAAGLALAAGLFLAPSGAAPQAGAAVALTPAGEALVLRPAPGRGRAGVLVFTREGTGAWSRRAMLEPGASAEPYEGFGASLTATEDLIAVAGADDDGIWGARMFRRTPHGWRAAAPLPLAGDIPAAVATAPAALDMAGLMRIMSPPARVVALGADGRTLALWGEGPEARSVRVFRRGPDDAWIHEASLPIRESDGSGPPRLAMGGDRIVVGDPGQGRSGSVRVFVHRGGDDWALEAELRPELAGRPVAEDAAHGGPGFGHAVALLDERLAVGMPGAGKVLVYRRDGGTWAADGVVPAGGIAETGGPDTWFGAAVALDRDGLWVGAPRAEAGRGAVHRYARDPATGTWRPAELFILPDILHRGSPTAFGYALAVSEDLVVAGAPAADRGAGGAAVIERRDGAWRGPTWLETGVELRSVSGGEVRCRDGRAGAFECGNVDLLSFLSFEDLGARYGEQITDIWGWADPETGREYALVGRGAGMSIVDVTSPTAPAVVGLVTANPASLRDIKVYRDHAFFVGDGAGDHGLVVFDLRRIRGLPRGEPVTLEPDARYTGIGSAHNLIMDPETGLAVPVGASGSGETCGGGLHMVDVSTPTEPEFAGCYTDDTGLIAPGRTHDGQCLVYRGPDRAYHGRRICLASNETVLRIVDVTDPAAPVEVARASYPGVAYTHQGWLTEDQRYFFMNDELDELVGTTDRTRTIIWDVADLDDPIVVGEHLGPDNATDHNLFIRGDRMYQANYQAGMRVVDISDPENPRDIGFFDTTPYGPNPAGFGYGAWTAYPFLPSGTVLVSSMHEGLFMLRPRPNLVP
ncbi:MAG: choice-of-anchor B family protein [Gemmatimonadetes bacterium]|nr:choice-of-anchor B family protein [Gemmatimonadota bacterium]